MAKALCDGQVNVFLDICDSICFPVSLEKTFWGSNLLVFLGLLIDIINQVICIPAEKIIKAKNQIAYFLNKGNRKVTVLQVQKLCGTLNFLCKCVVPGRAFITRLYAMAPAKLKQHHHVRISQENRLDLEVWDRFLDHPQVFCRPFIRTGKFYSSDIDMYSDASGIIGCGAYCDQEWTFCKWNEAFLKQKKPSIEYLELYGLTVGVLLWIGKFKNRNICLFCDNESVKHMVNNLSAHCPNNMFLIRLIALETMVHNVHVTVKHVKSKDNEKADALSRLQFDRFSRLAGDYMNKFPTEMPSCIWLVEKIWIDL